MCYDNEEAFLSWCEKSKLNNKQQLKHASIKHLKPGLSELLTDQLKVLSPHNLEDQSYIIAPEWCNEVMSASEGRYFMLSLWCFLQRHDKPPSSFQEEMCQPRMGKIRVICSRGILSAAFFFDSGWLNSLGGRIMSWPLPWLFSRTQPQLATWCSRNLSRERPSMLIACNLEAILV